VGGSRQLMQSDGIHPNAAGAKIIGDRLAPVVAQALRAVRAI
jgi:acyl-CoA thioesterase I